MTKKKKVSKYGGKSKNKSRLSTNQLNIISKIPKPIKKRKPTKNALKTHQTVITLLNKINKDFNPKQIEHSIKTGLSKVDIPSVDYRRIDSISEVFLNPINFLTKCIITFLKHNNPKDAKRLFHILKNDFLSDALESFKPYYDDWDEIEFKAGKDMVPTFIARTHDYFDILDTNVFAFYYSLYNTSLPFFDTKNDRSYFIRNYPSLGKQLAQFRSNKKKMIK